MKGTIKKRSDCGTCGIWNRRPGTKHGTCGMDGSKTAHFDHCVFHQEADGYPHAAARKALDQES